MARTARKIQLGATILVVVSASAIAGVAANGGPDFQATDKNPDYNGKPAAELIYGNAKPNTLNGQGGADEIRGRDGNDSLYGSEGNDEVYGEAGNDTIFGGMGNDSVSGGDGGDSVDGGPGNDAVQGGVGNNTLRGQDGDDFIYATGSDTIYADNGNDYVHVADSQYGTTVYAGEGNDTIQYRPDGSSVTRIDCGGGTDTVKGVPKGFTAISGCESIERGFVPTVLASAPSKTSVGSVGLSIAAADRDGAGDLVEMRVWQTDGAVPPWEPIAASKQLVLSGGYGTKIFAVQVRDRDGLVGGTFAATTYDKGAAPVVTSLAPELAEVEGGAAKARISYTDAEGDVRSIRVATFGLPWSEWTPASGKSAEVQIPLLHFGQNLLVAQVRDANGNESNVATAMVVWKERSETVVVVPVPEDVPVITSPDPEDPSNPPLPTETSTQSPSDPTEQTTTTATTSTEPSTPTTTTPQTSTSTSSEQAWWNTSSSTGPAATPPASTSPTGSTPASSKPVKKPAKKPAYRASLKKGKYSYRACYSKHQKRLKYKVRQGTKVWHCTKRVKLKHHR